MTLKKIISGGQTGADRAALDVAIEHGFACGGYCPKGCEAEDGVIDAKYPLEEIEGGYRQRTLMNLKNSDGTLIVYDSEVTGGTELTLFSCIKHHKPYKLIDLSLVDVEQAKESVEKFIKDNSVQVLNVAGPRASACPSVYGFTAELIQGMFEMA